MSLIWEIPVNDSVGFEIVVVIRSGFFGVPTSAVLYIGKFLTLHTKTQPE